MEIMTAKEQAIELYENMLFTDIMNTTRYITKECAIIAVNHIIAELDSERVFERIYFWNEVKEEIIKL